MFDIHLEIEYFASYYEDYDFFLFFNKALIDRSTEDFWVLEYIFTITNNLCDIVLDVEDIFEIRIKNFSNYIMLCFIINYVI